MRLGVSRPSARGRGALPDTLPCGPDSRKLMVLADLGPQNTSPRAEAGDRTGEKPQTSLPVALGFLRAFFRSGPAATAATQIGR